MVKKIYLVYKNCFTVLSDYFNSLNIFYDFIELDNINTYYNSYDIFIFSRMILPEQPNSFYSKKNILFLNEEQLSESNRSNWILTHIKHNLPILDYSVSNILLLKSYIKELNIDYDTKNILWLPYQYNSIENFNIKNDENDFEYDIGIINAKLELILQIDNNNNIRKREIIWNKVKEQEWSYINIIGWGKERDDIIKKCKIIINVHNFDCFNIFEHIRCDRLLFANKIIISDLSLFQDELDIKDYVIWEEFDKIIDTAKYILQHFDKFNIKRDLINVIDNRKKVLNKTLEHIMNL